MRIRCEKCGYEWDTRSSLKFVTCPSCRRKVRTTEVPDTPEQRIAERLRSAGIAFERNVWFRELPFSPKVSFVIPSATAPRIAVEVKTFKTLYPKYLLKDAALQAMLLKKKQSDLRFVLVAAGISRDRIDTKLTEIFDRLFFEDELDKLAEYVKQALCALAESEAACRAAVAGGCTLIQSP